MIASQGARNRRKVNVKKRRRNPHLPILPCIINKDVNILRAQLNKLNGHIIPDRMLNIDILTFNDLLGNRDAYGIIILQNSQVNTIFIRYVRIGHTDFLMVIIK